MFFLYIHYIINITSTDPGPLNKTRTNEDEDAFATTSNGLLRVMDYCLFSAAGEYKSTLDSNFLRS